MRIAVLGAGAWGTALAAAAAARNDTLLWARDPKLADTLRTQRSNPRYLEGVVLPPALHFTADRDAALAHARDGLTVIATPMSALRCQLASLPDDRPVLWLCKGFEAESGLLGHEVAHQLRPSASCGVLSGPSFAAEVARGQPTALVAASTDPGLVAIAVEAFHAETLRLYSSADIVGVEVGGAVKNVLAIAVGILDGMAALPRLAGASPGPGLNARAALITRGLAEMTRLGLALGARPETFMGLSGLGDLVLTATGDLSRNRKVGLLLAAGRSLPETLAELGHVAEGVYSAATVCARAAALGVEMPIAEAVSQMLDGRLTPALALRQLMSRDARPEA